MRDKILYEKANELLKKYQLEIYSLKRIREFDEYILELRLNSNEINAETLAEIHRKILEDLDEYIDPNVFFSISTKGAEYSITTSLELSHEIGNYLYLVSPQYQGTGTLVSFESNVITLEINDKGRIKKININFENASKIRRSVKF